MKRLALKFAFVSLLAVISFASYSQDEKTEKDKEKKKDVEQIIITLKGDKKEKVIIEVNGDKVLVNGKPSEDLNDDDIKVMRNKFKSAEGLSAYNIPRSGGNNWNFNYDDHNAMSFYSDAGENRAMLGVVTEKTEQGAKVLEVTDKSAAEKAGIKSGDVITKIGDTKVANPDELTAAVRKHKPGEKITVTLLRDKKEQKLTAELGKWKGVSGFALTPGQTWDMKTPEFDFKGFERQLDQPMPRMRYDQSYSWSGNSPRLGLSVQDTEDGKGVKVIEVDEDGNAAKAGVKENDILTHFNGTEVNSADVVAKMVRESKDKPSIKLQLKRDGKTQNIEVKMPRKLKTADL
jgi:serine protease Do